jgi:hypothetical protein
MNVKGGCLERTNKRERGKRREGDGGDMIEGHYIQV